MEHYLLIARSVTQAQRMERALGRAGLRGTVFRTPMELTEGKGCTYAVKITPSAIEGALPILNHEGLQPIQIFFAGPQGYQEVAL